MYGLQPRHYSSLPAPNFQPTATQERDGPCGNQHYSRDLLMMGITVPETSSQQPGHLSSLPAPNFQPTSTQKWDGPCGNQHYSRDLLMMGIRVPETC